MKLQKFYMHTLEGEPAVFDDGAICLTNLITFSDLRTSLQEIRREQNEGRKYRRDRGMSADWDYGYVKIYLPIQARDSKGRFI